MQRAITVTAPPIGHPSASHDYASDQRQAFDGRGTGLTNAKRLRMALLIAGIMALSVLFAGALIYFREDMLRMGNWGYLGVFVAEMGNSAAIFIPTPGPLVTLAMASILNPVLVGLIGGVAASLGELFGYVVGASGRKALEGSRILDRLQALLGELVWIDINRPEILQSYGEIDHASETMGRSMAKNDVWIAATAKATGATLLTTDKDFDHLDGNYMTRIWIDPELTKE